MSAAPRLAWGRGGVSPSAPSTDSSELPPPTEAGSPYTAKHGDTVWFLDDVFTCFTHWVGSTMPCVADDETGGCPLCRKRIKADRKGFAAALVKVGVRGSHAIWQPRVLRIPLRNIDTFQPGVRGRIFKCSLITKGNGARMEAKFIPSKFSTPPCEAFDAKQVMANTWFPQHATSVIVPAEVLVTDDTVLSPKEKTHREEIAEMESVKLVEYYKRLEKLFPSMAEPVLAEIINRGIKIDHPDPEKPAPKERKHNLHVVAIPQDDMADGPVAAERKRGAA